MHRLILGTLAPAAALFGAFALAVPSVGAAFKINTHTTLRFVGPTPTPMGFRFEYATPESQGMSTAGLEALRVFSNQLYPDNGILVMRFDKVVLEQYHGQTTITKRRASGSATKSGGAALVRNNFPSDYLWVFDKKARLGRLLQGLVENRDRLDM